MLDMPDSIDPERQFAEPDAKATAVAITVSAQVSSTRSIVMQTYLARDSAVEDYNAILDKVSGSINRQEAKFQLEEHEANLALEEKTLRQLEEDFGVIEERARATWASSRKKGEWPGLSPQELAQKGSAETNIRRYRDAISKRKFDMAKLRAIAEG